MTTITVTSSELDTSGDLQDIPPLGVDFHVPTVDTEVVVRNGIADVEPSFWDFDENQDINRDDSDWYNLQAAVQEADRILSSLDECNPPTLDDRFRLNVALDRIRKGADKLERHIAKNGLWMSKDEWRDCDDRNTWHWF